LKYYKEFKYQETDIWKDRKRDTGGWEARRPLNGRGFEVTQHNHYVQQMIKLCNLVSEKYLLEELGHHLH
jgi:hypothetical protein